MRILTRCRTEVCRGNSGIPQQRPTRGVGYLHMMKVERSKRGQAILLTLAVGLTVFLAACGSSSSSGTGPNGLAVTLTVSQSSISSGQTVTLVWTSTNASSVSINNGIGNVTPVSAGSITTPALTATTTYTITATGSNGSTATASQQVTVTAASTTPTVTLASSASAVNPGQTVTLTWTSTNATSAQINDGIGTVSPVAGGTVTSPAINSNTTFTITVSGAGGQTATASQSVSLNGPAVTITANPSRIASGNSSVLTVTAVNASGVTISNTLNSTTYSLPGTGGTETVSPTATVTYTATAIGENGTNVTASATVTVTAPGSVTSINHVIFMMQENRTFDTYFGMLNPYKEANGMAVGDDGNTYLVDGIDDKLSMFANQDDEGDTFNLFKFNSACIDDESSAWLESYGDVNRYNFATTRPMLMDGFVHTAEGYAKTGTGAGSFTDLQGKRAMGYYDQGFLNYYYYMAGQFAVSDRWFSPVASKSTPNRIATYTGGTTQGLVRDPFVDDSITSTLSIETIFQKLDSAGVSWRIYYSIDEGGCDDVDGDCGTQKGSYVPVTTFTDFAYAGKYIYSNPGQAPCNAPTIGSKAAVGDPSNSFCIDPTHIAPLSQFFADLKNGTLASYSYIEAAYGVADEHPGSGQSILQGQQRMAQILNAFMTSSSWKDSVFFVSYDEGGGPFDHVPPVQGKSNTYTDASLGTIPDISTISVNPDSYEPCLPPGTTTTSWTPTLHCDLKLNEPGDTATDAPAVQGFAAQLGFRLPNLIISPFTRKHYVSHIPMDHTAIDRFVEDRFIGDHTYLTNRDAAQPNLLDFFDFTAIPWATPPTPPTPVAPSPSTCTPTTM